MKRADDFREFMNDLRPLEESIYALPDFLPDGSGAQYLLDVSLKYPVAENPYDPSELVKGGLKVWDSAYLPMPRAVPLDPRRPKDVQAVRSINSEWENSTKVALNKIGRPDGVHFLRPKGRFIFDAMNDDIRMLQGAHIITHRECIDVAADDFTFGEFSEQFMRNLVKLFMSRKFGIPMSMHPEKRLEDAFKRYGIEVFWSPETRAPTLMAKCGAMGRICCEKTVAVVLASVGIEPHPRQAAEGVEWKEHNKWSCLPTIVALSGWECVDFVTHSCKADVGDSRFYCIPCGDLQPMSDFEELLDMARRARGDVEESEYVTTAEKWLGSADFEHGLSMTPQLPCPHCIRLNDTADGVVRKPRGRKPKTPINVGSTSISKANTEWWEWHDYVKFMRNCIAIGRYATAYAVGSVTAMRRRNSAFRKRCADLKKLVSLAAKYGRYCNYGFITEAEETKEKMEKLKEELAL